MSNAVLSFDPQGINDFQAYGMAYRDAALEIWESLGPRARRGAFADMEFVPVLFLLRHSMELTLKYAALHARAVLRLHGGNPPYDDDLLSTHHLIALYDHAVQALRRAPGAHLCPSVAMLPRFRPALTDLHRIDPGSYTFRYPVGKDARLALPQHFRFSSVNAIGQLVTASQVLVDLGHEVGEWWEWESQGYFDVHGRPQTPVLPR
jgi:hypothetical protein